MKKYNENDEVKICMGVCSVEEVVRDMWDLAADNDEWNVKDDLKDYKDWDFTNGKKYVVEAVIGSRGYYEGVEIIREGEVLLEKDLAYGTDYWMFRKEMLEELEKDYKDGDLSKEDYERNVKLFREGSNRDISERWLVGCINDSDDNAEWNEESQYHYYVVDRLKRWEDQGAYRHIKGN